MEKQVKTGPLPNLSLESTTKPEKEVSQNLKKVATIVDIMQLKEQGLSKCAVASELGISRDTVSKYWDQSTLELVHPCYSSRSQLIDSYQNYITDRIDKYPDLSAKRLFKEIKRQCVFRSSDFY